MAKIQHTPGPWEWKPEYKTIQAGAGIGRPSYRIADGLEQDGVPNAALIALAPTAPHPCDVPDCPGAENKRKLEAYDALEETYIETANKLVSTIGAHEKLVEKAQATLDVFRLSRLLPQLTYTEREQLIALDKALAAEEATNG